MFPYTTFFKSYLSCKRVNRMKREDLKELQISRLRNLVSFVLDHSEFYADLYRKAGIRKENVNSITVNDLPVVEKKILMENFDRVVTDKNLKYSDLQKYIGEDHDPKHSYMGKYKILHTSGTSGTPGIFPISIEEMAVLYGALFNRVTPACAMDFLRKKKMAYYAAVHGHFIGIVYLISAPELTMKIKTFSILDPLPRIVEELNKFQPVELSGYASSMEILAKEKMDRRLKISPKRIVCGGDLLCGFRRKKIADAFGISPCDSYSMTEGFGVANQIFNRPELMVFDDFYVLETEPKTRVCNLYNHTFPIIRYENEDILKEVKNPDYKDFPFTQIEKIEGRDFDSLEIVNNRVEKDVIHPAALVEFYVEGVEKFQFWERPFNTILIKVVGQGMDLRSRVQLEMLKLLKNKDAEKSVIVDVEIVDKLDVDPKNGKFKLVNKINFK